MKKLSINFPANYCEAMKTIQKRLNDYDIVNIEIASDAVECHIKYEMNDKTIIKDERAIALIKRLKSENEDLRNKLTKNEIELMKYRSNEADIKKINRAMSQKMIRMRKQLDVFNNAEKKKNISCKIKELMAENKITLSML